ncbi:MAG TPA: hypothetical protein VL326_07035 [Kofleriaceae bacterium]|nr:hypothetical protein [Kofleriaceae bacterium]
MQVARQLGRSEGYVNNLVRILERASLPILQRWCDEQRPTSGLLHVCATDWLMQVCILPHAEQDVQLAERVAKLSRPPANGEAPPAPRTRPPSQPPERASTDRGDAVACAAVDVPDPPAAMASDGAQPKS